MNPKPQGRASAGNSGNTTTGIAQKLDSFADVKRACTEWLAKHEDKYEHADQWWRKKPPAEGQRKEEPSSDSTSR